VITARVVDPGAQAAPGVPLVTIEQSDAHHVEAIADESLASALRKGDRVTVAIGSMRIDARIASIVPSFDAATHGALVTIELPSTAFAVRTGSFAKATFRTGTRSGITVPLEALARKEPPASMFVVGADGVAHLRLVTIGAATNDNVEVLSGLDPGERIVTRAANLRDGVRLATSQADAGGQP
jgi:membrane fusion protein, multidrug efflux system